METAQPAVQNSKESTNASAKAGDQNNQSKKKLSYKDKRELEQQLKHIEKLEQQQEALQTRIADPEFYSGDKADIDATLKEVAELQKQLEEAYQRWEALEG